MGFNSGFKGLISLPLVLQLLAFVSPPAISGSDTSAGLCWSREYWCGFGMVTVFSYACVLVGVSE